MAGLTAAGISPEILALESASAGASVAGILAGGTRISKTPRIGSSTDKGEEEESTKIATTVGGNTAVGLRAAVLDTPLAGAMLALPPEALGAGVRTSLQQKTSGIAYEVSARNAIRKAVLIQVNIVEAMDVTENTLTYGMFLLALSYFRIMNQLAKLKALYGNPAVAREAQEHFEGLGAVKPSGGGENLGMSLAILSSMSEERKRMIMAEREKLARMSLKRAADARALAGRVSMKMREHVKTAAIKEKARALRKRQQRLAKAATRIQKFFRRRRVERTFSQFKVHGALFAEYEALRTYAATVIQAGWRGFIGRQLVRDKKAELRELMIRIRKEDVKATAEAFYKANPLTAFMSGWGKGKPAAGGEESAAAAAEDAAAEEEKEESVAGGSDDPLRAAKAKMDRKKLQSLGSGTRELKAQTAVIPKPAFGVNNLDPYGPAGWDGRKALLAADPGVDVGEAAKKHHKGPTLPPQALQIKTVGEDDTYFGRREPRGDTQGEFPPPHVARALAAQPYYSKVAPAIALDSVSTFSNTGLDMDATALLPELADGRSGPAPYLSTPLPRTEPLLSSHKDTLSPRVSTVEELDLTGYKERRRALEEREKERAKAAELAELEGNKNQMEADKLTALRLNRTVQEVEAARRTGTTLTKRIT